MSHSQSQPDFFLLDAGLIRDNPDMFVAQADGEAWWYVTKWGGKSIVRDLVSVPYSGNVPDLQQFAESRGYYLSNTEENYLAMFRRHGT